MAAVEPAIERQRQIVDGAGKTRLRSRAGNTEPLPDAAVIRHTPEFGPPAESDDCRRSFEPDKHGLHLIMKVRKLRRVQVNQTFWIFLNSPLLRRSFGILGPNPFGSKFLWLHGLIWLSEFSCIGALTRRSAFPLHREYRLESSCKYGSYYGVSFACCLP